MKTFVELITEVKQCIDQEDNKALANIEDSMESTTVATSNHALGSYLIYDKKVYEVTTAISVGDTLVIYPATGYNIKVADDIMTMIETLTTENQTLTNKLDDEVSARATLGAHNFAKCEGTTQIIGSEVQFTVNDDGSVTANTVATTTATRDFLYMNRKIEGGTYKISGSPSGSNLSSYLIWIGVRDSTNTSWVDSRFVYEGEEKEITIPNDSAGVQILLEVKSGQTFSNKIFKPLLCLASDPSTDYAPYAMTNRELTEKSIIKDVSGYSWDSAIDGTKDITVKRYGAIVSVYGYFRTTNALAQYANVLSGLPHCASGAALSADIVHNMGMTLQNVDSATSKFIVNSATTANLQYAFNFVYLTDN